MIDMGDVAGTVENGVWDVNGKIVINSNMAN